MNRERKRLAGKVLAAMSVVSLLDAGATVVLPYVSVTQDAATAGGQIEARIGSLAHMGCGTAYAESSTTIPSGETMEESRGSMRSGGIQTINDGGAGIITTMFGGSQQVYMGGTGTVSAMSSGTQMISSGGGTIDTMFGGRQTIYGGTGTVSTMSAGLQIVYSTGNGTVITMLSGGQQNISEKNGVGTIREMNGGTQYVLSGGT
ncbi:MAG: hypothetical protein IJU05_02565, partial [Schwartzia sp.]|nr:hypothetical protein [Schwartzia sp. (in: firmicutes)]